MPTWQHFLTILASRWWTLDYSLGRTRMETQTMVERPSNSFDKLMGFLFYQRFGHQRLGLWIWPLGLHTMAVQVERPKAWPLDFQNGASHYFGQRLGLWTWPLEASHYGCSSREAVGVHGQRLGLWTWPLEASHYGRPKAPISIFYYIFQAQAFGLSTSFGHELPRPLDLDGHSVNQPLVHVHLQISRLHLGYGCN